MHPSLIPLKLAKLRKDSEIQFSKGRIHFVWEKSRRYPFRRRRGLSLPLDLEKKRRF
jgi:hypothetical protein